jgi:hypothetical protein
MDFSVQSFMTMLEIGRSGENFFQENAGIARAVSHQDQAGLRPEFRAPCKKRACELSSANASSITDLSECLARRRAFDTPRSASAQCEEREVFLTGGQVMPPYSNRHREDCFGLLTSSRSSAGVVVVSDLFSRADQHEFSDRKQDQFEGQKSSLFLS